MYSRREFGKMMLAGLPLSRALAQINSKFRGVQIGAITYVVLEIHRRQS